MLPATDFHSSSSSSSSLGLSFLHRRRDQVHSMDSSPEPNAAAAVGNESEAFQRQVADRFHDLASADTAELLSIPWLRKLLDTFLCCHEEFRAILFNHKSCLNKSPIIDRQISDYFERAVKALDVLNAIRDGIEQIRQWKKPLEIVLCALNNQRSIGEGQIRRAKKALIDLTISMLDEKESNTTTQRNRSFGRNNLPKDQRSLGHFRSLSWSISRNWSAARQLQAICNNLTPPRTNDIVSTNGLALAVFTMSHVLLFVMWALVAAIPCQDRGLQAHFSLTKQFVWAAPILSLHERILEGSKKRGRRNTCGLLKEIQEMEKCARHLNEFTEMVQFPVTEEKEKEVRGGVKEVAKVYEDLTEGLDPLERQVREVFRRIVRSRTEGLDSTGRD